MNVFHQFTRKSLLKNRTRTLVTVIGIVLSMALFTAVIEGAYSGVQFLIRSVVDGNGAFQGYYYDLTEAEAQEAQSAEGIKDSATWQQVGWAEISENEVSPYLLIKSISGNFSDLVAVHLVSGRMPENENEIILPVHLGTTGGVQYTVGDTLTLDVGKRTADGEEVAEEYPYLLYGPEEITDTTERTYTVVGIYERLNYSIEAIECPGYTALTAGGGTGYYSVFFTLKPWLSFYSYMEEHAVSPNYRPHSGLLQISGSFRNGNMSALVYGFAAVLVFLISFGSISLIYNSFSISVSERTRQFGIAFAQELGLGGHFNMVLQAAFFKLMPVIPVEEAVGYMKAAAEKTYFAKGEDVVRKNLAAIDAGIEAPAFVEIPESWADAPDLPQAERNVPAVVTEILEPLNEQKGDDLPVSKLMKYKDGVMDMGLTAYEKRRIATRVPVWNAEACIQCNRCSYVCPHAVVRPYLLTENEKNEAPESMKLAPAKGKQAAGYYFTLQVSEADCTGCGSCANVCPSRDGALTMVPVAEAGDTSVDWEYALHLPEKEDIFDPYTVKGSQFRRPLLEFSAACAGCGETPYAKLLTQLYGDRVYWANATGCSQAWGSAMPGIPYTVNQKGCGPAWSNSLFENNAEFSLGMVLSVDRQRNAQKDRVTALRDRTGSEEVRKACDAWLDTFDDFEASPETSAKLIGTLEGLSDPDAEKILRYKDMLTKKTFWMYGGDGWAYDIGFGGLDHVLASGENVNVLIVDTEVYSNTGGQSSKATPVGAVAQFTAAGKKQPKKDIGSMLMTYGNVYVAQVAQGADNAQLIKAVKEAQEYNGPSVIIAYAPCQEHGLKCGAAKVQDEMKKAVDAGYWFLYRFNPAAEPSFHLDSKAPSIDYEAFLDGEVRYASLRRTFPENAKKLFAEGAKLSRERYEKLASIKE